MDSHGVKWVWCFCFYVQQLAPPWRRSVAKFCANSPDVAVFEVLVHESFAWLRFIVPFFGGKRAKFQHCTTEPAWRSYSFLFLFLTLSRTSMLCIPHFC